MNELIKDGSGVTSADFYIEAARRKMDSKSDAIVSTSMGTYSGKIVSVGMNSFTIKSGSGLKVISMDNILDIN